MVIEAHAPALQLDETGTVRVGGTRVTLDTVVGAYLDGASAESIAEAYPAVSLADVYETISYYLRHRGQLDDYLRQRKQQGEELRRQIESRPENREFRERLLSRAREQGLRP
jgi:uncharacterized protein (DUF433 family)